MKNHSPLLARPLTILTLLAGLALTSCGGGGGGGQQGQQQGGGGNQPDAVWDQFNWDEANWS